MCSRGDRCWSYNLLQKKALFSYPMKWFNIGDFIAKENHNGGKWESCNLRSLFYNANETFLYMVVVEMPIDNF